MSIKIDSGYLIFQCKDLNLLRKFTKKDGGSVFRVIK